MKSKKSKKADLEHRKPIFLQLGLVLALSCVLFAFEWKQSDAEQKKENLIDFGGSQDLADVPITKQLPPAKPSIPPISIATYIITKDGSETIDLTDIFEPDAPDPEIVYTPVVDLEENGIADVTDSARIVVDFNAEYPGGMKAMKEFFAEKITYPAEELQIGMEGTLYVSFIVEKNGDVSNVAIARSLSNNLDNEALKVVKMMPKWKAASDHGKPARQLFTIPFQFKIK